MQPFDSLSPFLQEYIMLRRSAVLPPVVVLVVYMLMAIPSAEGSLLCFGADGHVAIEYVAACKGSELGPQFEWAENDACGHCKDVQLLSSPALVNQRLGALMPHDHSVSFQSVAALLPSHFIEETQPRSSMPFQESLASRNSVVLRI